MNKKTFILAVIFLICALAWSGVNFYWRITGVQYASTFDLIIGPILVVTGFVMVYNEFKKKKRRHLDEVNRHKIP